MTDDMIKLAHWIMKRAIERDPNSNWAKEATEQWLKCCEKELEKSLQINIDTFTTKTGG